MERYFITGGAGFIGSHTVDLLIAGGAEVTIFDKKPWSEAIYVHHQEGKLRYVEGNICDQEALRNAMEGHTHVLHLAAIVSVPLTIADPVGTHAVNVTGALNVFEAARTCRVERVVYASSAAVYGRQEVMPIDEEARLAPLSPYGLHKMINEEYAALYLELFGMSIMGLRYFNVYGTRQDPSSPYSGVISIFAKKIQEGGEVVIFGDGTATRDFVSVESVAQANMKALQSACFGVCNVGSGTETTVKKLFDILSACVGKEVPLRMEKPREGDIIRSLSSVERMKEVLGMHSEEDLTERLKRLFQS